MRVTGKVCERTYGKVILISKRPIVKRGREDLCSYLYYCIDSLAKIPLSCLNALYKQKKG